MKTFLTELNGGVEVTTNERAVLLYAECRSAGRTDSAVHVVLRLIGCVPGDYGGGRVGNGGS